MPVTSAARSRVRISDEDIGLERMHNRAPRRTLPLVTAATVAVPESAISNGTERPSRTLSRIADASPFSGISSGRAPAIAT